MRWLMCNPTKQDKSPCKNKCKNCQNKNKHLQHQQIPIAVKWYKATYKLGGLAFSGKKPLYKKETFLWFDIMLSTYNYTIKEKPDFAKFYFK